MATIGTLIVATTFLSYRRMAALRGVLSASTLSLYYALMNALCAETAVVLFYEALLLVDLGEIYTRALSNGNCLRKAATTAQLLAAPLEFVIIVGFVPTYRRALKAAVKRRVYQRRRRIEPQHPVQSLAPRDLAQSTSI